MKSRFVRVSSLALLSLFFAANAAFAQFQTRAAVPFAFQVNGKQFPAGTYSFEKHLGNNFISIHNLASRTSTVIMGDSRLAGTNPPELVFQHTGGQYYLTQIWGNEGIKIPVSVRGTENTLAGITPPANSSVEIALN